MESSDILQQIQSVEYAIQQVEGVKTQLSRNVSEVKNTISTNFSRHLEGARNREVWLLNQVDLIKNTKDDVLQRQLIRLHRQLSSLQNRVSNIDETMQDLEAEFEISDLRPEETPHIAFRADPATLRDAVINYGRVDPNGLLRGGHFEDPRKPSASLPPQFEDYDDAQHHVLYKTVEETKKEKIDIKFPHLSTRSEDWLCRSSTVTGSHFSKPTYSFPAFSSNTTDWLKQPITTEVSSSGHRPIMSLLSPLQSTTSTASSSSFCGIPSDRVAATPMLQQPAVTKSITNWLHQIRKTDIEDEEDFEVVEHAASVGTIDTDDILDVRQETELKIPHPNSSSYWLQPSASMTQSNDNEDHNVFKSYFASRNNDISAWLCKDKQGCCNGASCSTPPSALEIENLGNYISENLWLKQERRQSQDNLKWLCKANEQCCSFSECLSKPSCLEEHQNTIESTKSEDLPGFKIFQHSVDDDKKWLVNGGKNVEPTTRSPSYEQFNHMQRNTSAWLKSEQSNLDSSKPNITQQDFHDKQKDVDQSLWLHVKTSDNESASSADSCTWQNLQNKLQGYSDDQWLFSSTHRIASVPPKSLQLQEMDREQWLLRKEEMECETPEKEDTEMLMQDDDTSKWLIH